MQFRQDNMELLKLDKPWVTRCIIQLQHCLYNFISFALMLMLMFNRCFRWKLSKICHPNPIHWTIFLYHFLQVLFIHKYSGCMVLDSVIQISSGYFVATTSMIYSQHLTQGLAEPAIDLKYYGVVLFVIGITGNFYHHYMLC